MQSRLFLAGFALAILAALHQERQHHSISRTMATFTLIIAATLLAWSLIPQGAP